MTVDALLLGDSPTMRELRRVVCKLARSLHVMSGRTGGLSLANQRKLLRAMSDVPILARGAAFTAGLLAENNEEAEVGSQRPFIQVQQTQVGAVAQNQVVQYQDMGTELTVKPTISTDGYVRLQLTQEVNQATNQVQFNAPVISTRTLKTRLRTESFLFLTPRIARGDIDVTKVTQPIDSMMRREAPTP